jgi:hypothetical protein
MGTGLDVWLPLAVALVGVGGTLLATILTQMWSRRREDGRWLREREAEQQRWAKERSERLEQWQREDSVRWLTDRRQIYAEYLALLDEWIYELSLADTEVRTRDQLTADARDSLDAVTKAVIRALNLVRIIAPTGIAEKAKSVIDPLQAAHAGYVHTDVRWPRSPLRIDDALAEISVLREAMRNDLGIAAARTELPGQQVPGVTPVDSDSGR